MWTEITKAFPKFPVAMDDLLARFDTKRLLAAGNDAGKVTYAVAAARALTSLPASEQWDLIYPVWKPWLAPSTGRAGRPGDPAASVAEANIPKDAGNIWEQIPKEKRPHVESLFVTLLPAD